MRSSARLVARILNRERIGLIIAAIVFIGFAVAIDLPEWAAFRRYIKITAPPGGFIWVFRLFALGLALGGVWAIRRAARSFPISRHPLWQLVALHPEDIVWVHSGVETHYKAYGVTVNRQRHVFFLTKDPTRNQSIETFTHLARELESALEDELEHATFGGFSAERVAAYRANPASFYRK